MATPCYEQIVYGPTAGGTPDPDTDVIIPLTGSHSLTGDVVYADDERTVLYIENRLELESIIYLETMTGSGSDVEEEVDRIRSILETPALELKVYPAGLGEIDTINDDQPDVAGGPLPQYTFVEHVASNNAIMIRWSVIFRTIRCPTYSADHLLQYSVEQDMDVDDDGNLSFNCNITFQRSVPIADVSTYNNLIDILTQRASKSFQGMKVSKRSSLSRDGRTLSIRITHKEIQSDNAYHPYTSSIQAEDSLESSLLGSDPYQGQGFYTWSRVLTGTINLPARIHKSYAWSIMLKIIRSRFKKLYPFSKLAAVLDVDNTGQLDDSDADKERQYYLPLHIRIREAIYERKMSFSVRFMIVTDLDNLLHVTKIMQRVNTQWDGSEELSDSKTLSEQWKAWHDAKSNTLNGKFNYTYQGLPSEYNQCSGVIVDYNVGPDSLLDDEEDQDEDEGQPSSGDDELTSDETARDMLYPEEIYGTASLDAEVSWLKYDNDFEIIDESDVVPVHYLEQPSAGYYKDTDQTYASRGRIGLTLNGRGTGGSAAQTNPASSISRGHSKLYIKMSGHAIRLKHPIPTPTLVSVAGQDATRVQNRSSQKQVSQGDVPVYLAKWEVIYLIEGGDIYRDDILASIITTGAPAHYR